jgi:hypothetical protein
MFQVIDVRYIYLIHGHGINVVIHDDTSFDLGVGIGPPVVAGTIIAKILLRDFVGDAPKLMKSVFCRDTINK